MHRQSGGNLEGQLVQVRARCCTMRIMLLLVLKLVLTPTLLAAATLASRRWGGTVAGVIGGFPLTSAPLSFILLLEHGPGFASAAARGTLAGLINVAVFALIYAWTAVHAAWPFALLLASAGFCASAAALLSLESGVGWVAVLAGAALAAALAGLPRRSLRGSDAPSLGRNLLARMAVGVATILALSALASRLGAELTGLLAAAPVVAAILAGFAHAEGGAGAAANVLKGVLIGGFSFAAFFLVIGVHVQAGGAMSYFMAAAAAGGVALVLVLARRWMAAAGNIGARRRHVRGPAEERR